MAPTKLQCRDQVKAFQAALVQRLVAASSDIPWSTKLARNEHGVVRPGLFSGAEEAAGGERTPMHLAALRAASTGVARVADALVHRTVANHGVAPLAGDPRKGWQMQKTMGAKGVARGSYYLGLVDDPALGVLVVAAAFYDERLRVPESAHAWLLWLLDDDAHADAWLAHVDVALRAQATVAAKPRSGRRRKRPHGHVEPEEEEEVMDVVEGEVEVEVVAEAVGVEVVAETEEAVEAVEVVVAEVVEAEVVVEEEAPTTEEGTADEEDEEEALAAPAVAVVARRRRLRRPLSVASCASRAHS